MQKDDPSFLTRPEASDAEQRPGKAGVGGGGVELGKGEVNRGQRERERARNHRVEGWRGDEPAKGRGTRRRNDRVEVKTTAQ